MSTPADDLANEGLDPHRPAVAEVAEPVDLSDLPEIEPGPDGGGEGFDPVLELSQLMNANALAMNELGQQGVKLDDSHPMITSLVVGALLEEILRCLAGEGAVTRVLLTTHQQIADLLTTAASQVAQAKLMAGASVAPVHNGRVTGKGRLR